MMLLKKEWKLVMMPVPLLFLLLSALVLVPNYPYYVTFFYTTLGIFLMMQSARENRDLYYMALLPVTKREMVRARFLLVLSVEALQVLVCVPFMLLRASYGSVKNAVGIEANAAFLGLSLVLLGRFQPHLLPDALQKRLRSGKAVPAFEHRAGAGCSRPGDASAHPALFQTTSATAMQLPISCARFRCCSEDFWCSLF